MSSKDKKLLIMLAGILLMVLSYFTMYRRDVDKAETLQAENVILSARVSELEAVQDKCPQYEADMVTMNAAIDQIIDQFPVYLSEENSIMDVVQLENETKAFISSLTIADAAVVDTSAASQGTGTAAVPAADTTEDTTLEDIDETSEETAGTTYTTTTSVAENAAIYSLYDIVQTVVFDTDYDGMKNMVSFIAEAENPMSIEQIGMTFNRTSGMLSGTMEFNSYYLTGQDKSYVPADIPEILHGVDNIFGQMLENQDSTVNGAQ